MMLTVERQVFRHTPALVREALQALAVHPGGRYIDATVGEGGHALAILEASSPGGQLLGLDLDTTALERARARLSPYEGSFTLARANYARLGEVTSQLQFRPVQGILFDLGMSSLQLEAQGRGFSFYLPDAPLDMRFDPDQPITAEDIVNNYSEAELARLLRDYGEEPKSRAIARLIVARRPLKTVGELLRVLQQAGLPSRRLHPATRVFQALRIAVNQELDNLREGLGQALPLLSPGGKLAVLSYHSLEDRIVKEFFSRESRGCLCPPQTPACLCGHTPSLRLLTRKAVRPSPDEAAANPRSRSARLRAVERLANAKQLPREETKDST